MEAARSRLGSPGIPVAVPLRASAVISDGLPPVTVRSGEQRYGGALTFSVTAARAGAGNAANVERANGDGESREHVSGERVSPSARSPHAGPAAETPPDSRLRPCTAVACCSSSSVAQQPRAAGMTASKREQAKGEARMRCSGSRAGNGCEPRMRRTWWPRPTAGPRGAGGSGAREPGSQCIRWS